MVLHGGHDVEWLGGIAQDDAVWRDQRDARGHQRADAIGLGVELANRGGRLRKARCSCDELRGNPCLGRERLLDKRVGLPLHRDGKQRDRHNQREKRGRESGEEELDLKGDFDHWTTG